MKKYRAIAQSAGILIVVFLTLNFKCVSGGRAQNAVQSLSLGTVLDGRVLSHGTSEPIPDVHMVLMLLNPDLLQTPAADSAARSVISSLNADTAIVESVLSSQARRAGVSSELLRPLSVVATFTNGVGAFRFENLQSGRYALIAQHEGYIDFRAANGDWNEAVNRFITIEAGKEPGELSLYMVRGGIISGQVLDPPGQPLQNTLVGLYELSYPNGRATMTGVLAGGSRTDDHGEFRQFWIPPGQYFIGAILHPDGNRSPLDLGENTFYPGVADAGDAKPVTVNGDEIKHVDIHVIQATVAPLFKISGKIDTTSGGANHYDCCFYLVPRDISIVDDESTIRDNAISSDAAPNGEFELRGVKPGDYDLYPMFLDASIPAYVTSRTPVVVQNADVSGLSITIRPGAVLQAEITVEDTSMPTLKLDSIRLRYRTIDTTPFIFLGRNPSLGFDAKGKLVGNQVPEARYAFGLDGLPASAYVADIRQSGKSVYDDGVVAMQNMEPVQIVVNPSGGEVTGVIATSNHKPAANATVVLIPPANRRRNSQLYRTAVTDEDGHFSIGGILPDSYTIFALQDCPPGEPWLNAAFLAKFQERANPISVDPNSSLKVALELILD